MTYFDSSYLAKFYLDEPESEMVRARVRSEIAVGCSTLGRVEVVSVFHRKFRENSRSAGEFLALVDQFELDCASGFWTWLQISDETQRLAVGTYRRLASTVFLRSADALHLACAAQQGVKIILTNDRHMLAAAPHFGLTGEVIL